MSALKHQNITTYHVLGRTQHRRMETNPKTKYTIKQ